MNNNVWIWFFFRLQGRIRRMEYLLGSLFLFCAESAVTLADISSILLSLVSIWTSCALPIKRLHDMGYSGYVFLAAIGIFILLTLIVISTGSLAVLTLLIVLGLSFNIWLLAARGQTHDNQFGPPPIAPGTVP